MKLIVAIINKEDTAEVCRNLSKAKFSSTKLATQGGFLLSGNTTLLIGVEDDKVDEALEVIKTYSKQRKELIPSHATFGMGVTTSYPLEVVVGGATIFILDVDRFEKY